MKRNCEPTLFDLLPPEAMPPPPPRVRLRERRHACELYIRKVKGNLYQVRWWVEADGSVHCGLYDRDMASKVKRDLLRESARHPATALGIWAALRAVLGRLRDRGADVPDVLPKWVERGAWVPPARRADGTEERAGHWLYWGRVERRERRGGPKVLREVGPFDTAEAAHLALRAAHPPPKRVRGDGRRAKADRAPGAAVARIPGCW